MNKNLWSVSYLLVTGGTSVFLLWLYYQIVDVAKVQLPLRPFIWMGQNAIVVFVFGASGYPMRFSCVSLCLFILFDFSGSCLPNIIYASLRVLVTSFILALYFASEYWRPR